MRILHIWDQAGVACILAKHHRKMGHDVRILKRSGYDPFDIFQFYGEPLMKEDGKSFINYAIKEAGHYDVIHVHSLFKIIPELRRRYRDKKLILHYHGSEVRKESKDSLQQQAERTCDVIIGSTKDLEPYVETSMIYVPNPVDTDHFKPSTPHNNRGKAFTFETTGGDVAWVLQYLKDNHIEIEVEVLDRQSNPIQYSMMPHLLTRYAIYVDLKFIGNVLLQASSKTALECLACGLQVIDHNLRYIRDFPDQHRPEIVANQVLEVYDKT